LSGQNYLHDFSLSRYKDVIKGIFVGHGHMWVYDKLFDSIDVYETDSFGDNGCSPVERVFSQFLGTVFCS